MYLETLLKVAINKFYMPCISMECPIPARKISIKLQGQSFLLFYFSRINNTGTFDKLKIPLLELKILKRSHIYYRKDGVPNVVFLGCMAFHTGDLRAFTRILNTP